MKRHRIWRGVLAAAVVGVVEAAGLGAVRREHRRPLRVVWVDDREPADPLAGTGLWLLDPLRDPKPEHGDVHRRSPRPLRLTRLHPAQLLRAAFSRRS